MNRKRTDTKFKTFRWTCFDGTTRTVVERRGKHQQDALKKLPRNQRALVQRCGEECYG